MRKSIQIFIILTIFSSIAVADDWSGTYNIGRPEADFCCIPKGPVTVTDRDNKVTITADLDTDRKGCKGRGDKLSLTLDKKENKLGNNEEAYYKIENYGEGRIQGNGGRLMFAWKTDGNWDGLVARDYQCGSTMSTTETSGFLVYGNTNINVKWIVALIILIVVLLVGCGAAAFFLKRRRDAQKLDAYSLA